MNTEPARRAYEEAEELPADPADRTDAVERGYCLVLLSEQFGDRVTPISGKAIAIGRKEENDIVLPDLRVSGHHAEVFQRGGKVFVRDLGSVNGTRLNGAVVKEAALKPNDKIEIAGVVSLHFADQRNMRGIGVGPSGRKGSGKFVLAGAQTLAMDSRYHPPGGASAPEAAEPKSRPAAKAAAAAAESRIEKEVERRVAERYAETSRLARERGALLAMAAHDLRTPLDGMLDYLDHLMPRVGGDPRSAWIAPELAAVRESAASMMELLEDLLDRQRAEFGELKLALEKVDLEAYLRELVATYQRWAAAADRRVELKIDGPLPPVAIDRKRMMQILNSLIHDALKHTPRGHGVTIEAAVAAGRVTVEIAVGDEGCGFDPNSTDRMLFLFAQGAGAASAGLAAIVERLAKLHGGALRIEGPAGSGGRRVVVLPVAGD